MNDGYGWAIPPTRYIASFNCLGVRVTSDPMTAEELADFMVEMSSKSISVNVTKSEPPF